MDYYSELVRWHIDLILPSKLEHTTQQLDAQAMMLLITVLAVFFTDITGIYGVTSDVMPAISNTTNHARARSLASAYTLDRDTDCRVASCLGRTVCRQCLEAINASTNAVHTEAMWDALSVIQLKEVETTMIQVLLFNPSCAATVKSNSMIMALSKTLDDLGGAGMMTGISTACIPNGTSRSTCPRRFGMVVGPCAQVVYNEIMTNQSGRLCFSEIYAKTPPTARCTRLYAPKHVRIMH